MHTLSVPCLIMASINFYVGIYYLLFYIKRPQIKEHFPFALLCLSVSFYDMTCVGLYNANALAEGVFWQRLQLDSFAAICIFAIWFSEIFTGRKNDRHVQVIITWFIIFLVASPFISPEYSLSATYPAIKHVHFFNLLQITYYESVVGIVYRIEIISAIITFVYIFYLYVKYYRKTRNGILLLVLVCELTFFLGAANDSMVAMQIYPFIYVSEYPFFLLVVSMAYTLLDRFVNFHKEYEALNVTLEQKVEERTREIMEAQADIKTLAGLIPICSNCKKIRGDKGYWEHLESYIQSHTEAEFSHGICPDCARKLYPEFFPQTGDENKGEKEASPLR